MKSIYDKLKDKKVSYKEVPSFNPPGDGEGIRAITFEGLPFDGKKTKVFAYLGYPEDTSCKVPAIVLVHGGGGVPFASWVKRWNRLGYAAIAMSVTGDFPTTRDTCPYKEEHGKHREVWSHGFTEGFSEEGYTVIPDNDTLKNSEEPIEKQWLYNALGAIILSCNILRDDPFIDENKIGITGVSWGGVLTSIALSIDPRFAFAIPIYGSGYMAESMARLGVYFRSGKNPDLWLCEKYFSDVKCPVLWLCWNSDYAFSLNSNSDSYIDTVKNNPKTRLCAIHKMMHAHWNGWGREESYAFADSVVKGSPQLPRFAVGKSEIINPDNVKINEIKIYYLTNPLCYIETETEGLHQAEEWKAEKADLERLPHGAKEYYYEITGEIDGKEYITTTELRKA